MFDKNQKDFPTGTHYNIWFVGTQILPVNMTLPAEMRNIMNPDLIKSCEQMHGFFMHLLSDMYENIELYLPLPNWKFNVSRKMIKPFNDLVLLGEADDESLRINRLVFEKYMKKLANSTEYKEDKKQGVKIEHRLKLYERSGLYIQYVDNMVILTNTLYPNMFFAMKEMANIASREKASYSNSFTYCDFRKLCKDYKYDKYENALVFLNDEQTEIARTIDAFADQNSLKRSINNGHCAGYTIVYSYKKIKIMSLNCLTDEIAFNLDIPYDKNNLEPIGSFFKDIENDSDALKTFFYKRIHRCRMCNPNCGGFSMRIFNKPNRLCHHWRQMLNLDFGLTVSEIQPVKKLLGYTVKYIDTCNT